MSADNPAFLSGEDLTKAAGNNDLRSMENGNGLVWLLRSSRTGFERLVFSLDEAGVPKLEVSMLVGDQWPVKRDPSIVEMVNFVRVAKHFKPGSEHTKGLETLVRAKLEEGLGAL